jgi:hypothetical protein
MTELAENATLRAVQSQARIERRRNHLKGTSLAYKRFSSGYRGRESSSCRIMGTLLAFAVSKN